MQREGETYPIDLICSCCRCALSSDDLPYFDDSVTEAQTRALLVEAAWEYFTRNLLFRNRNVSWMVVPSMDDCVGAVKLDDSEQLYELGVLFAITLDFKH